jgi:hypothetical protein
MRRLEAWRLQRACDADRLFGFSLYFFVVSPGFYLLVFPVQLRFFLENYFTCMPTDSVSQHCRN